MNCLISVVGSRSESESRDRNARSYRDAEKVARELASGLSRGVTATAPQQRPRASHLPNLFLHSLTTFGRSVIHRQRQALPSLRSLRSRRPRTPMARRRDADRQTASVEPSVASLPTTPRQRAPTLSFDRLPKTPHRNRRVGRATTSSRDGADPRPGRVFDC